MKRLMRAFLTTTRVILSLVGLICVSSLAVNAAFYVCIAIGFSEPVAAVASMIGLLSVLVFLYVYITGGK